MAEKKELILEKVGLPQWTRCAKAEWEKKTYDGRTRDYLVLRTEYKQVWIPTSTRQNSAWMACIKVFEEGTGKKLNGDIDKLISGKEIELTEFKITYPRFRDDDPTPPFVENRFLITSMKDGGGKIVEAPPKQDVFDFENKVLKVITETGEIGLPALAARVLQIDNPTPDQTENVQCALFSIMDKGWVYEPKRGKYKSVDGQMPVAPQTQPAAIDKTVGIVKKEAPVQPSVRDTTLAASKFIMEFKADDKRTDYISYIAAKFYKNGFDAGPGFGIWISSSVGLGLCDLGERRNQIISDAIKYLIDEKLLEKTTNHDVVALVKGVVIRNEGNTFAFVPAVQ